MVSLGTVTREYDQQTKHLTVKFSDHTRTIVSILFTRSKSRQYIMHVPDYADDIQESISDLRRALFALSLVRYALSDKRLFVDTYVNLWYSFSQHTAQTKLVFNMSDGELSLPLTKVNIGVNTVSSGGKWSMVKQNMLRNIATSYTDFITPKPSVRGIDL